MIVQSIGGICLGLAVTGFIVSGFANDKQAARDILRTVALFLIASAICFK